MRQITNYKTILVFTLSWTSVILLYVTMIKRFLDILNDGIDRSKDRGTPKENSRWLHIDMRNNLSCISFLMQKNRKTMLQNMKMWLKYWHNAITMFVCVVLIDILICVYVFFVDVYHFCFVCLVLDFDGCDNLIY